jgi:site-specific DNA recombinase
VYYRCHTRTCPTTGIREEAVENKVTEQLRRSEFTEDEKDYLVGAVRALKASWIAQKEQSLKNLEARREQLTERLTRLTDAYLDGAIDRELFEERKAAILFDRQGIQGSIASLQANEVSVPHLIEQFLERAGSAYSSYQMGSTEQKRRMVKIVSSNLSLREKSVDFTFSNPFGVVAEREKVADSGPRENRTPAPAMRMRCNTTLLWARGSSSEEG